MTDRCWILENEVRTRIRLDLGKGLGKLAILFGPNVFGHDLCLLLSDVCVMLSFPEVTADRISISQSHA